MKSYKINIKVVIATVGVLSLIIFSLLLIIFGIAKTESLGELLLHYGFIIAPVSILWVLMDRYFWHTKLFQSIRKSFNIPPDLRGRWEGILENADGTEPQQFAIEVTQTLTDLHVHSFSSIAHSQSILCEIASSTNEDKFTLCYLWEGHTNTSIKDIHQREQFDGYTMLQLHEHESPKVLLGSYFTNRKPAQTHGGIELKWISRNLKGKL